MVNTTIEKYLGIQRVEDPLLGDWSFATEDTQYTTHRFHPYPARMVPQIARRIILAFTNEEDVVLDPFCGSGTVLTESRLLGRNSVGIDINPLAILIANTKANPPSIEDVNNVLNRIKKQINELRRYSNNELKELTDIPKFTNINYWFKDYVILRLAALRVILRRELEKEDIKVSRFFWICFAWTVRQVSSVRKREYKLYRLPQSELSRFKPDVYLDFLGIVKSYISGIREFWNSISDIGKDCYAIAMLGDSRNIHLKDESVDLIVTSPPYGDSKTTVAYGQFSRLQLCWLGYNEKYVKSIDDISLGGRLDVPYVINVPSLKDTVTKIRKRDKRRALEAIRFYYGLWKCTEEMYRVLDRKGVMAIVIANRSIRRVRVPTHQIVREYGEKLGMKHVRTVLRKITRKRLPWENAPENIPGLKERTMAEEHIVILRKV